MTTQTKTTWRKVKLGDVAKNFDSKRVPLSSMQRAKIRGEYPYYGAAEIVDYINDYIYDGLYLLIAEDGTVTANGNKPMLQLVNGKFWVNNHAHILQGSNDSETKYLFYALRNTPITPYITGAVQLKLTQENLNKIGILYPEEESIREKITSTLSAFDDKIELNNKISRTLEQMAQAIFKEWFVNFRFPGNEKVKMIDSELGKIPEGWEVKNLGEVADVQWGDTSITKASYIKKGYLAYSASGPDGYREKYDFDRVGIVLSAIGANCGLTWLARDKWSVIKNTIRFWSTDKKISTEYLFLATMRKESWPQRGSAQPFITMGDARKRKILIPSENILKSFNDFAVDAYFKIDTSRLENQKLAALRDLLLPKLMSGAVEVRNN